MTLEEIKKYQSRKVAIRAIDDEINWVYGKVSSPNGRMTPGSLSSSPSDPTAQKVRRIETLRARREILEKQQKDCEKYVDDLEDFRVAAILRYKYILGWTWENTAMMILGSTSYQPLIKRITAHFGDTNVTD